MVLLLKKIFDSAKPDPTNAYSALLMAGWFSLHTANAETVNYVSARSDSLSTLLVLAALVTYTRILGRWRHLAYIPLAVGILVKASAVMFVPILFLYELFLVESIGLRSMFARSNWPVVGRVLRRVAPAAIIGIVFFGLVIGMTPGTDDPGGGSVWSYLITQPFVVLRYFWTFFVPIGLSADTDWTLIRTVVDPGFVVGIAFIAGALALAVTTSEKSKSRPIAFGILWFFIALVPTSSIYPLGEVMNDHRMYFPFVGLTLAVGWALALLASRYEAPLRRTKGAQAALAASIVLVLLAHAAGTFQRNQVWDSDETLWADVTVNSPNNGRGLMNFGTSQMRQGRYDVALEYFERALKTDYGNHPYLYINLALAKAGLGQFSEVESYYLGALERGQAYPATNYYYANWLVEQGRIDEATFYIDAALGISPGYEPAIKLQAEIGQYFQLVTDAEALAGREPTIETFLSLSLAYFDVGMFEQSIGAAEQALAIDPQYAFAYNNICAAHNSLGQYEEAISACTAALEIDPDYQLAENNLAWALTKLEESDGSGG